MKNNNTRNIVLCGIFTALIAVGAFIKIPVPIVPFTLQTFFITLCGLILPRKYAVMSVLCYVTLGLIGFPIFAEGGGLSYIIKPTFGYLLGFLLAVFVISTLKLKLKNTSIKNLFLISFAGILSVYPVGMIYYFFVSHLIIDTNISVNNLFLYCFLLFIPSDIICCFLSSIVSKRIEKVQTK